MLHTKNMYNRTRLIKAIGALDTTLYITQGQGDKFMVPAGDHYFATIRTGDIREFVKVVSADFDKLHVVRAQDNSTAHSFPVDACITVEWNPEQLCGYVKTCALGMEISGVSGTVCIDCGTCLTLDSGKITKVNGEQKC